MLLSPIHKELAQITQFKETIAFVKIWPDPLSKIWGGFVFVPFVFPCAITCFMNPVSAINQGVS